MTERFRIRVTKDQLVFCSGHFITYDGTECERLHGHNYRTAVEIEHDLDPNFYVFDFIALKARMKELTDELDHHMLLAMKNPILKVEESPKKVKVSYKDKEWIFPREDCVLMPIENTTAELLAKYLAGRLVQVLKTKHNFSPTFVRVDVDESFGQTATYEVKLR